MMCIVLPCITIHVIKVRQLYLQLSRITIHVTEVRQLYLQLSCITIQVTEVRQLYYLQSNLLQSYFLSSLVCKIKNPLSASRLQNYPDLYLNVFVDVPTLAVVHLWGVILFVDKLETWIWSLFHNDFNPGMLKCLADILCYTRECWTASLLSVIWFSFISIVNPYPLTRWRRNAIEWKCSALNQNYIGAKSCGRKCLQR